MFGATLLLMFKNVTFIIKFWGDLADQPGSVVVYEECQETEVPGSILGGYLQIFLLLANVPLAVACNVLNEMVRIQRH